MKFKRLLSGFLAATVAVTTASLSSLSFASAADIELPTGVYSLNSTNVQYNFVNGTSTTISGLENAESLYITFDVTGVTSGDTAYLAFANTSWVGGWNPGDDGNPGIELTTDGTYTVYATPSSGIPSPLIFLGIIVNTSSPSNYTFSNISASTEAPTKKVLWTDDVSATENDHVTATLYEDYELVFSGTGAIKAFTNISKPWTTAGYSNTLITKVTVEEGITELGTYFIGGSSSASYVASSLTSVSLPTTLTTIGTYAFAYCSSLTEIDLSNTAVTTIGAYAFRGMSKLKTISFPSTLETIGGTYVLAACPSLESVDLSNTKITDIPGYFLYNNTSLTSIKLPDSVRTMGNYVFRGCTSLTEVVIPDGVESLSYTFYSCTGLTKVVIPPSVTNLSNNVFYGCTNQDLKIYICSTLTSLTKTAFGSASASYAVNGTVYVNDQTTYDTIDTTASARSYFTLVLEPDLTDLRDAIAKYDTYNSSDYTEASFKAYTEAVEAAAAVNDNYNNYSNLDTETIKATVNAVNNAAEDLVLVDASEQIAALKETYELYKSLSAVKDYSEEYKGYSDESWTAFTDSLDAAAAALENEESIKKSEAEALNEAIINAYNALEVNLSYALDYFTGVYGGNNYMSAITDEDLGDDLSKVSDASYVNITLTVDSSQQYNIGYGTLSVRNSGGTATTFSGGTYPTYTIKYSLSSALDFDIQLSYTGWNSTTLVSTVTGIEFYNANDELIYTAIPAAFDFNKASLGSLNEKISEISEFLTSIGENDYTAASLAILNTIISEAKAVYEEASANAAIEKTVTFTNTVYSTWASNSKAVTVSKTGDYTAEFTGLSASGLYNLGYLENENTDDVTISLNTIVINDTYTFNVGKTLSTTGDNALANVWSIEDGTIYTSTDGSAEIIGLAYADSRTDYYIKLMVGSTETTITSIAYNFSYEGIYKTDIDNEEAELYNVEIDELTAAFEALEAVDTTTLKAELAELIATAEAVEENKYSSETYEALLSVLESANETYDDENAVNSAVQAAIDELTAALEGLTTDKTALEAAIAVGEAVDSAKYTVDSYAVLTSAISAGKAVLENADATQADIDAAAKAITDAIDALEYEVAVIGNVTGTILVSDEDDSTEMTVAAVSSNGHMVSVTAASMGTYVLEGLEAGDYTLTISGGKYAERTYEITVETGDITLDVNLNPLGDINGDGKVTTADVGLANSHAKGVTELTDYAFVCGDVNGDGGITTADVGMINSHAKAVKMLW